MIKTKTISAISNLSIWSFYIVLGILLYSCTSIPKLPKEDKQIINEVVKAPLPEFISGETGFTQVGKHQIWFEKIAPANQIKGTVILIMGNGQDALSWPPNFISNFIENGYQVIRYDHRGTGLSTSEEKWKKKNAYSLNDMAQDVIAILNTNKVEKAHIVGVSMGGMIAQIVAIENPNRTISLTSIMSSGDVMDSDVPPMSDEVLPKMISTVLKKGFLGNKKGQIKRQIIQKRILMGEATGAIDVKSVAQVSYYNLEKRKGYNLMAARHHYQAILNAKSRLEELQKIRTPTLIIHGLQDPVMPIEHGKKLLATIPNADSLWIENMGHDLPDGKIHEMTMKIITHFESTSN